MPLPKGAEDFLNYAFKVSKRNTIIHFYDFEREEETNNAKRKVLSACKANSKTCQILKIVKCGQYSPGKLRLCVDFIIED